MSKGGALFGSLPRRYARALIQIAQEEGQTAVETYGKSLDETVRVLKESAGGPSFLKTLADEAIDYNQRQAAVRDVADRLGVPALFKNFLGLLVKKERVEILPEIAREYQRLQDEILGIVRVSVVTPSTAAAEGLLRRVEGILSQRLKKKVITHAEADPKLIGGIVLRVSHTVYDGSIRKELERIRNAMLNA
jgi:F-type H+-transporting ATPase subunit delta